MNALMAIGLGVLIAAFATAAIYWIIVDSHQKSRRRQEARDAAEEAVQARLDSVRAVWRASPATPPQVGLTSTWTVTSTVEESGGVGLTSSVTGRNGPEILEESRQQMERMHEELRTLSTTMAQQMNADMARVNEDFARISRDFARNFPIPNARTIRFPTQTSAPVATANAQPARVEVPSRFDREDPV